MIYDIEIFKGILSVELEELELGDRIYDYKVDSLIKLLENFGCENHFIDRRAWDDYALITMKMTPTMIDNANDDEEAFISRVEEIVLMIFGDCGAARYLPPVFVNEMSQVEELFEKIKQIEESFTDPDDQMREVEKVISDMGLSDTVKVEKMDKDGQKEIPDVQMIDLQVEIVDDKKAFSVVGFDGEMTKRLSDKYGTDISKIAEEIEPNVFRPLDINGKQIKFESKREFAEWLSGYFQVV